MKKKTIKVFISYSWDSESHKLWVLELVNKLIENGVNVILDRYELRLGNDLFYFMEKSVGEADKVLLIFTPNYKLKAEKRNGGVGHEYSVITSRFAKDRVANVKFIPVLRNGNFVTSVPINFESSLLLNMTSDLEFDRDFEYLLREIYEKPEFKKPKLGNIPKFNFIIADELRCLSRKVVLKIEDESGDRALCVDDMTLRVLKDRNYYEDVFSSDSSFVENIKTHPGVIVDSRNENGKFIVKTEFDKTYKKWDIINYSSSCVYLKCHSESESYFSVWSEYKMDRLEIIVCFPLNRKYIWFEGYLKSTIFDRKKVRIDSLVKETQYMGLPALRIIVLNLDLQDKYSIEWAW